MKKKQDWFKSFEGQRWKFDLRRRAEENQEYKSLVDLKAQLTFLSRQNGGNRKRKVEVKGQK